MPEIQLTQGKVAQIDDEDYARVAAWRWHAHRERTGIWYARCRMGTRTVYMHRFIMGGTGLIDHENRDGLDNRRRNLRPADKSLNAANQRKSRGSSRYKGVSWYSADRKWRARIKVQGKQYELGQFADEADAGKAYDAAARGLFGPYARINFPTPPSGPDEGAPTRVFP
jgi:hypothetical protein